MRGSLSQTDSAVSARPPATFACTDPPCVIVRLLGIFFWREGLEVAFGPERRGEKGGCMKSLNKMHASIRTRAILALRPSGERAGKDPAHHAEILVRAELE